MAANVGTLLVEIGADVAQLRRDMGKAAQIASNKAKHIQKSLKGIETTAGKVSSSINLIGAGMAALAIGSGIKSMVGEFAALDSGLVGVKKTTGIAGDELQQLGRDIQAITTTLPLSTEELLGLAQSAGQLGVKGSENILKFTKTVGMLGTASDLSGEQAAMSLARLLNVAGESAAQVDILGSVIVALGNNMPATESEIARMATEVGQATAAFKVSSAEAAALGAALKSVGARAEGGGSVIGRAFRAIDESIRGGGESLAALQQVTGMTGEQLRETFAVDSIQVFQAFIGGLGKMMKSGRSAAEVLEAFGLKGDENLKILPVLASRSELFARALSIANRETENATALTTEALEAAKSFSAQMAIVGNQIDITAVEIGRQLAPAILEAARAFAAFVSDNKGRFAELARDAAEFSKTLFRVADAIAEEMAVLYRGYEALPGWMKTVGILGAFVGGKKGAVVLGTLLHLTGKIIDTVEGAKMAAQGKISWDDFFGDTDDFYKAVQAYEKSTEAEDSWLIKHKDNLRRLKNDPVNIPQPTIPPISSGNFATPSTSTGQPDRQIKAEADAAQKIKDIQTRLAEEMARLTMGRFELQRWELGREIEDMRANAAGQKQVLDQIEAYRIASLDKIAQEQREASTEAAQKAVEDAQRISEEQKRIRREMLESSNSIADGFSLAMDRCADTSVSTSVAVADAWTSAMTGVENSIISTVKTGEFELANLANLADSILSDLLRVTIRNNLTEPILGGFASIFSNHSGGVVGTDGTPRRVSPAVFAGAPRFHSGGIAGLRPDEVPTILQRNEEVLTRSDPRHRFNGGGQGQGSTTVFNINVTLPQSSGDTQKDSAYANNAAIQIQKQLDGWWAKKMQQAQRPGGQLNGGVQI